MVPEATVEAALTEVSGRHPDFDAFQDDLSGNGLSIPLYRLSLERELKVEAVLEKVDSRAARVSDIDVELYYQLPPRAVPAARSPRSPPHPDHSQPGAGGQQPRGRHDPHPGSARTLGKGPETLLGAGPETLRMPNRPARWLAGRSPAWPAVPRTGRGVVPTRDDAARSCGGDIPGAECIALRFDSPAEKLRLDQVREKIREVLADRRKRLCQKAWLRQAGERNHRHESCGIPPKDTCEAWTAWR